MAFPFLWFHIWSTGISGDPPSREYVKPFFLESAAAGPGRSCGSQGTVQTVV